MTKAKVRGMVKTWKEDRGFGFIKPDGGGKDIFLHISSLKGAVRRPAVGDVVYYSITKDQQGKFKAINALIEGVNTVENKTPEITHQPYASNNKIILITVILLIIVALVAAVLST